MEKEHRPSLIKIIPVSDNNDEVEAKLDELNRKIDKLTEELKKKNI